MSRLHTIDFDFEDYMTNEIKKEISKVEALLNNDDLWKCEVGDFTKYKDLKRTHADLHENEEIAWRKRSRAMWLKEGD